MLFGVPSGVRTLAQKHNQQSTDKFTLELSYPPDTRLANVHTPERTPIRTHDRFYVQQNDALLVWCPVGLNNFREESGEIICIAEMFTPIKISSWW